MNKWQAISIVAISLAVGIIGYNYTIGQCVSNALTLEIAKECK